MSADAAVEYTYEALTTRRTDRPLTELPRLVGRAAKLVWDAGSGDLAVLLALSIGGGALGAGRLLAARAVLGRLAADDPRLGSLVPAAGALVMLTVAGGLAGTWAGERNRVLGERVSYHAQTIVATAACEADLVDFERPAFHNRLQRALSNLGSRPLVVTAALASLVGSIASIVAISAAIVTIQPLVFAVLLLSALPLWLVSRALGRRSFGFDLGQTESDRRRGYLLGLMVQKAPAKELRAFRLAPHLRRMLGALWDRRIDDVRAHARRRAITASLGRIVNGLLLGAIVIALGWMVTSRRLSLANAGVVATGALLIGQGLQAALGAVGQLYESALFLEDAEAFVRTLAPGEDPGSAPPFEQLTLDSVSFRYPGAGRDALHDVSITVRAGELVALVGANGSGKTTLAKVMAQLYAPTAGEVAWNGRAVLPAERAGLRDEIAVLFQDFDRYLFSAAENVGFGRVEALADHDRVLDAAVRAGIDRRIAQLPDGFATLLGPEFFGGTDLSGGEWQRVALARAFFRRAPLLVLDEPTSAMDPDAEHDLFLRLRELWADRAVVLVSHRFSNVMGADRIVVLDQGRIVEVGTHTELLEAGGRYATMFRRQAEPYQLVGDGAGGTA